MTVAINPERRKRRPKKNRAQDFADNFSIYVNPQAKIKDDPEQLQKRAHPILLDWKESNQLKDQILRAVLQYSGQMQQEENQVIVQSELLLDRFTKRIEGLIRKMRLLGESQPDLQEDFAVMSEDLLEFTGEFIAFHEEEEDED